MNKEKRKSLTTLIPDLDSLKNALDKIRDEEQKSIDAIPEGFQQSQRGADSEAALT